MMDAREKEYDNVLAGNLKSRKERAVTAAFVLRSLKKLADSDEKNHDKIIGMLFGAVEMLTMCLLGEMGVSTVEIGEEDEQG